MFCGDSLERKLGKLILTDIVVLQLLGLLVTYFLLVVQMTTSSRDSAAADTVTTVP